MKGAQPMAIVKSKHASNYTVIPNEIFKQEMSPEAIGLLVYLLSLPHDWVIYKTTLHNTFGVGRDKMNSMFKELEKRGYILSVRSQNKEGVFVYEHVVYDKPFNGEQPYTEKPLTVEPCMDEPLTVNPPLQSTNSVNTNNKVNTIQREQVDFEIFWNLYDKKVGDKDKIKPKWDKLSYEIQLTAIDHIKKYVIAQPDKKYRKNPEVYLNNKSYKDEIISAPPRPGTSIQQQVQPVVATNGFKTQINNR
jgi:hypothetical protein